MGHPEKDERGIPSRWEVCGLPYMALWLATILQAKIDYRALVRAGLIVNGKIADPWPLKPRARGRSHLSDYRSRHAVQRLIDYLFGGGVQQDLEAAGIKTHSRILRAELAAGRDELCGELKGVAA